MATKCPYQFISPVYCDFKDYHFITNIVRLNDKHVCGHICLTDRCLALLAPPTLPPHLPNQDFSKPKSVILRASHAHC